jgi:hypothetical protein
MRLTDAAGNPNKPNILAYNLLLHAKLHLGAYADGMCQIIEEMEPWNHSKAADLQLCAEKYLSGKRFMIGQENT